MKNFLLIASLLYLACITCTAQVTIMTKDSLFQKATTYITKNKQEEALQLALQEIDKLSNIHSKKAQWLVLAGDIFNDKNEYDKAIKFYRRAFKINTTLKDSLALMQDHKKIGNYYKHKFNNLYNKRFEKEAIRLKDSVLFYYNKNIYEYNHIEQGLPYVANCYNNASIIYSDYEKLDTAQAYINKVIDIRKKLYKPNSMKLISPLTNQGLIYINQKNYTAAENVYFEVIKKTVDTSNTNILNAKITAFTNLSYIYEQTRDYKKAYEYSEKYNELSEILQEKQKATEITTIEAIHNEDKARAEATKVAAIETEKERKAKEQAQYILAATGLTSAIIILFGTVLYRNSKLKAKNLSLNLIEQELTQQKVLQALQVKNQSKILNATLDGRETERKEIAQTLHDSVSALLSSANMHLQVIKMKSSENISEIVKSQHIISEASDKVRDLSHGLISTLLLKFGLKLAIEDLCEKYSNEQFNLTLNSDSKIPRFEKNFEIKIHRIIEECINNIMKHSKASEASVILLLTDKTLHVTIKDNGVGFDTSKISLSYGIGLSQIKARIENMEGVFDIDSKINKGTSIVMEVPVEYT